MRKFILTIGFLNHFQNITSQTKRALGTAMNSALSCNSCKVSNIKFQDAVTVTDHIVFYGSKSDRIWNASPGQVMCLFTAEIGC